jgi:hypothetical protein
VKRPFRPLLFVAASVVTLVGPLASAAEAAPATLKWAEAHPAKSPPGRDSAAIAADGSTIVMFGGESATNGKLLGDTWTWTKGAWSQDTAAVHPPPLAAAAMAYDSITDDVVLFGGKATKTTTSAETWVWSAGKWSEDKSTTGPPARADAQMAYSPANKGLLLFSGAGKITNPKALTDTWLWTKSGWTKLSPKKSPPGSLFGTMVTDSSTSQVVLFTGLVSFSSNTEPGKTWIWNGNTWSEPKLSTHPTLQIGSSSAFDPNRDADVMFGGFSLSNAKPLSDAWAWTGKSWTALAQKSAPPGRGESAMAYDASSKQLLVFGGSVQLISVVTGHKDLADTWLGGP